MNNTLNDALKDWPDLLQENDLKYAARLIKRDSQALFDTGDNIAKNIEKEQEKFLAKLKAFITRDKTCLVRFFYFYFISPTLVLIFRLGGNSYDVAVE